MTDKNECNISGKVEGFQIIATKTGTSMIKFRVLCNKEKISIVAFRELADATRLNDGEEVFITGAIQTTSWQDKNGVQRYGFQIIANKINDNGEETFTPAADKATPAPKRAPVQPYAGGPF
ncbi:MAG: single-stranded DNA-binding protein [Desulfobulbaceae bacterium]|nr:single-stranded DNA-binding protein [Desulfobulbaceae bacterium]